MSEWYRTTLGEIGYVVTGKTPPTSDPDYYGGSLPFVTPTDMDGRRTIDTTGRYLSEKGASLVARARIPAGSVLVSCIGSDLGKAALVSSDCVTNQQINSLIVNREISHLFIYYNLCTRQAEIKAAASGSAQPILNKSAFGQLPIRLPKHKEEQDSIASVLGTLDEKIELNRRMNATLETMARSIFKDWFVDFGPVRAKMEGREPYLSRQLWELFPEILDDRGKPKGWPYQPLDDVVDIVKGRSYKSAELQQSRNALVTLKSFSRAGGYRADGVKPYVGSFREEQVVDEGEIIIAKTDVTQNADIVGSPARVINDQEYANLIASLDTSIVRPKAGSNLGQEFLLRLMETTHFKQHAVSYASGTTVLHLSKDAIPSFEFAYPDSGVADAFNKITAPFAERIISNMHENRTLESLRTFLLPKLMSGEISIRDAENRAAEVV